MEGCGRLNDGAREDAILQRKGGFVVDGLAREEADSGVEPKNRGQRRGGIDLPLM